ncbi:hypothetical protein B0T25DRAFT_520864 [Lasiosphaeria hispida]|uniref:Heterokaryon incompatibility domain-containing protein n=1 Tax=Lasiosphaeria hispida TaxID=260671 RepID=A0AAJ0MAU1_9PEZI|nr:hypothetical protein B0T25DRAFT_520864 [Lasiosphaeria hispida]
MVTLLDNPDAFVSDRQLKDGLSVSLLPQTFKDAVQVAHWFKVRWLWIDSLCILQDSDEDWQKEAVMMYEVYKNAILNISADDSPNARWGCFRDRDLLAVIPMSLHLPDHQAGIYSKHGFCPILAGSFWQIANQKQQGASLRGKATRPECMRLRRYSC